MDEDELRFAAGALGDAERAVAMTGAGVSTASGIPDFRGSDGVWTRYDPEDFHISRFEADPEGFWDDRLALVEELYGEGREPNRAHEALAALEREGHIGGVITQNVDGLHQAAGSDRVVELHGNGERVVCTDCGGTDDLDAVRSRAADLPPRCRRCDGLLKPDVVLFGERLPDYAWYRAHAMAQRADAVLVVGSSLSVEPAASLPREAAGRGATLVVVNRERTALSGRAEYDFRADATEALPRIRDALADY
ncbi:SIR2 family NAD-dependent protein deacylase [Halomarina pelagica]|uniref:SIR2 family NAD-dependent protein deacylase n=1 Tax=Halomarina pelagica TaxID=2961599 RepID=UPI0020C43668|nr:Sir2 family NAD-dependent protein deacetylase [Halomarina sp. BND7]